MDAGKKGFLLRHVLKAMVWPFKEQILLTVIWTVHFCGLDLCSRYCAKPVTIESMAVQSGTEVRQSIYLPAHTCVLCLALMKGGTNCRLEDGGDREDGGSELCHSSSVGRWMLVCQGKSLLTSLDVECT